MTTPAAPSATEPSIVIPALMAGLGAFLAWYAVKYWRGTGEAVYPSYAVKSVLQGQGLPAKSPAVSATAELTSYESAATAEIGSGGNGPATAYQGSISATGAENIARLLLPKYGWAASQMTSLIALWDQESSWSAHAQNSASGAYGIAQALGHGDATTACPSTGVNEYGTDYGLTAAEAQAANCGSVRWQIEWGLGYIKATYGTPAAAEAHEQSDGWY
jgi:hypothetical protein